MAPPVLTANVAARVIALVVAHGRDHPGRARGRTQAARRADPAPGAARPGIGVLVSCGLPSAAPYFLAGRDYGDLPRLRTTLIVLTLVGSLAAQCLLAGPEPAAPLALLPPVAHGRRAGRRRPRVLPALGGGGQVLPAGRERHARRQLGDRRRGGRVPAGVRGPAAVPARHRPAHDRRWSAPMCWSQWASRSGSRGAGTCGAGAGRTPRLAVRDLPVRPARPGRRHALAGQPAAGRGDPRRAGGAGHAGRLRRRLEVRGAAPAARAGHHLRPLPAPDQARPTGTRPGTWPRCCRGPSS